LFAEDTPQQFFGLKWPRQLTEVFGRGGSPATHQSQAPAPSRPGSPTGLLTLTTAKQGSTNQPATGKINRFHESTKLGNPDMIPSKFNARYWELMPPQIITLPQESNTDMLLTRRAGVPATGVQSTAFGRYERFR
jgi:hypothetical protein